MRFSHLAFALLPVFATGCVSSTSSTPWSKKDAVSWYSRNQQWIRGGIGYQGSDEEQHHFIVRVMDSWTFIQIAKPDLKLAEEHPFPSASSAQLFYYSVDPLHDFAKIEPKKEANQTLQPTGPSARG